MLSTDLEHELITNYPTKRVRNKNDSIVKRWRKGDKFCSVHHKSSHEVVAS